LPTFTLSGCPTKIVHAIEIADIFVKAGRAGMPPDPATGLRGIPRFADSARPPDIRNAADLGRTLDGL
jgi:hypothetical protein